MPAFVHDDLQRLGISLQAGTLDRLAVYLDLLLETNKQFNLTAVREVDEAWRRHIIDSLTLLAGLESLAQNARALDVGSGGGLPGIPIAIARPDLHVTLLESTGKKARFLESCLKTLPLANARAVHDRAETVGRDPAHRQQYDLVMCRAIGPMNVLLELALPLVKVGGRLLTMKGPKVQAELAEASDALQILGGGELAVIDAYPDEFDMDTVVISIIKDRPTPTDFPRLPGVPKHSPL